MKKQSSYSNFRDEPDIHLDDDDEDHFQNDKVWQSEIKTQFSEMKTRISSEKYKQKKGKNSQDNKNMKKEVAMDEHIIPLEELCQRLNVDPERGLSQEEAQKRFEMYGPNILTPPKPKSRLLIYVEFCTAPFSLLLWFASALCWLAFILQVTVQGKVVKDSILLAIVLIGVIFITATFAYMQTASSLKVMEGFSKLVPLQALVIRNGEKIPIEVSQLTIGDVVELKGGDKVPGDIRIIQSSGLKVDNSSLTGESEPQPRSIEMSNENPLETRNLAFYSTSINQGSGRGIIIKTGNNTVIGRIANLATSTENAMTPINREMHRFIYIVLVVAFINSFTFFGGGFRNYGIIDNIALVVGILVASVPEGVLISVSVCLTMAAKRMAAKNVLVKNLESVETLGSTSTICSDKTGTLTMNMMTVQHLWVNGVITRADKVVHGDEPIVDLNNPVSKVLTDIACLCNRAVFQDEFKKETIGDASESALIKYCQEIRDIEKWRDENPKFVEIPFNSINKFAVTVNKVGDSHYVMLKGAPERIMARCTKVHMYNAEKKISEEIPITEEWKKEFTTAYETLGGKGERVLGFCHARLDKNKYDDNYPYNADDENWQMQDLTFSGLISLIDPPRPAVPDAVRRCQEAGIRVVMVTGDHPITAKAISQQVGIISNDTKEDVARKMGIHVNQVDPSTVTAIVVSGSELMDMTDEELDEVIENHTQIVFARTSPQQKLLIVEGFQRRGNIVAVTGDGVNDSPALKKADIGIAMGITGSDVSKEAADMILLDDNFASIVKGIEEGRLIFDNLKKTVAYLLTANLPQIVPYYLYVFARCPLPITTILTLVIAVGTDLLPAISLSYEKAETDIMKRRPRDPVVDKLVTSRLLAFSYLQAGVIQAISGLFTYYVIMGDFGVQPKSLYGIGMLWEKEDKMMAFKDKNSKIFERDFDYRNKAVQHAQSGTFVAVVINQWGTLLMCKTRKLSLFQQGMWNWVMNIGLIEETLLFIIIIYVTPLHVIFNTRSLSFQHLITGTPFTFLMILYDEVRKFLMRRKNKIGQFVEEYSYY